MFKFTKDPLVRPDFEKEWILELRLYLSVFQLIASRLQALQLAFIPELEQTERKVSLILLLQSMQKAVDCLFKLLPETPSLNTPASSSSDESPCKS